MPSAETAETFNVSLPFAYPRPNIFHDFAGIYRHATIEPLANRVDIRYATLRLPCFE